MVWFVALVLLVAADPAKVGPVFLHLIREGLLRATEFSCDGSVGDAFRMILPELDNSIRFRIKFTETSEELLKQHAVCDDLVHRLAGIQDIIAEGAAAVRERLIQRSGISGSVVFTVEADTVTHPYEAIRAHAASVILLLMADTVSFFIEGVVLRLGDRNLFTGAANVDEIGLLFTLVVILFHNETSKFRVVPEPEVSRKKSVKGRPEREINPFQLPITLVDGVYLLVTAMAVRATLHAG